MSESPGIAWLMSELKTGGLELDYPGRLVSPPAWLGHTPFAFAIVSILRPHTVVELGVHSGNSYCAMMQAVQKLRLEARCFGIDHWQGEEHSGKYGEEVYEDLKAYHDPIYGQFSTLLRSSFDDALHYFPDNSIDLLHLDGFHTYEAASHDFAVWLPKMSSRGVMLFHDVNVREGGFGVWRLWRKISSRYPCFEFFHSHGLGVAYVGSDALPEHGYGLFSVGDEDRVGKIRAYFSRLGKSVVERYQLVTERNQMEESRRAAEFELATQHQALASLRMRIAELEAALQSRTADSAQIEELSNTTTHLRAEIIHLSAELSLARSRAQDVEGALKQSWIAAAQRSAAVGRASNRNLAWMTGGLRSKLTRPARRVLAKVPWIAHQLRQ